MRILLMFILSVAIFFRSAAQPANTSNKISFLDSLIKRGAILVIDGNQVNGIPSKLEADDILKIIILQRDKTKEPLEGDSQNGVIAIVTRRGAIDAYEKKLSKFSDAYKSYVTTNHGDFGVKYLLINERGEFDDLNERNRDMTKELYELSEDDIVDVKFSVQHRYISENKFCIIGVKQQ
jgi:hypothetical protein